MHRPGVLILLELGMGTEGFKDSLFTGEFKTQEQEFTTQEEKKKKRKVARTISYQNQPRSLKQSVCVLGGYNGG